MPSRTFCAVKPWPSGVPPVVKCSRTFCPRVITRRAGSGVTGRTGAVASEASTAGSASVRPRCRSSGETPAGSPTIFSGPSQSAVKGTDCGKLPCTRPSWLP